jgi:uncharacterized protein (TIGR00269 family)
MDTHHRGKPAAGLCRCGRDAAVYLHYSCQHMCAAHFIRMFDKRFRKTVRQFSMLKKGDRVAVGLSGGKDSCVLLHSLAELRKDLPFELVAITIDEGIAGYRQRTLRIAKRECERLGVEHVVHRFEDEAGKTLDRLVKRKDSALPCTQCGVLRRYMLNKGAREAGANKLATGHNLDDVAQTVLMNIMRNEPSRLARFNEPLVKSGRFVRRIRPLMLTPEKENAIYAMLKGIELERVECPYAHTAFRSHVRKMLNESEEMYPGTKFKVVNSFLEIEGALRSRYVKGAAVAECETCGEPCSKGQCMFCRIVR